MDELIEVLKAQRNAALDACALANAELRRLRAELEALKAQK